MSHDMIRILSKRVRSDSSLSSVGERVELDPTLIILDHDSTTMREIRKNVIYVLIIFHYLIASAHFEWSLVRSRLAATFAAIAQW
jgi:hypothetical protein